MSEETMKSAPTTSAEPMGEEEYEATQQMIVMFARQVACMRLPQFIAAAERAHATGPILDPTLYRMAMGRLDDVLRSARALNTFRVEILAQVERVKAAKE